MNDFIQIVPESCMQYATVFKAVRFESALSAVVGIVIGILIGGWK